MNLNFSKRKLDSEPHIQEEHPDYHSPLLSDDAPTYVVDNKAVIAEGAKSITKMVLLGVVSLFLIMVSLYTIFAGTLMYLAPGPGNSMLHVARNTYTAGHIPEGTVMYGSASSATSTGFFKNVVEGYGGVEDPIVVKVIAGPVDILDGSKSNLAIDGKKTNIKVRDIMNKPEGRYVLDDQFLVQCVTGNCEEGKYLVIDLNGLSGEVLGKTEGFHYSKVHSAEEVRQ